MKHRCAARGRGVGDDEAGELPVALQLVVEQGAVLRRRPPVDRVVRAHYRSRAALVYRRVEGRVMNLFEQAVADLDGISIATALADIGDEVLWGRDDAEL